MASVDLFVGNNTIIDQELYSLWLNGYSGRFPSFWEKILMTELALPFPAVKIHFPTLHLHVHGMYIRLSDVFCKPILGFSWCHYCLEESIELSIKYLQSDDIRNRWHFYQRGGLDKTRSLRLRICTVHRHPVPGPPTSLHLFSRDKDHLLSYIVALLFEQSTVSARVIKREKQGSVVSMLMLVSSGLLVDVKILGILGLSSSESHNSLRSTYCGNRVYLVYRVGYPIMHSVRVITMQYQYTTNAW